jgi:hypothetical protein
VIRQSDSAYLAFLLELEQSAPVFLERSAVVRRPVHLVQIDAVDSQPAKGSLALTANAVGVPDLGSLGHAVGVIPHHPALGEHIWPVTVRDTVQRGGHHLLGMTEAVFGRGVDPVHACVESTVDRGDRLVIILAAPAE